MKGILDSGILEILALNMESGIPENFTCEIRNPTSEWNPESKDPVHRIRNPQREIRSRIQDCLGFRYMGRPSLFKKRIDSDV